MKTVYYDRRSILTGRLNTDIFRLTFDLYLDFQFLTNHGHDTRAKKSKLVSFNDRVKTDGQTDTTDRIAPSLLTRS